MGHRNPMAMLVITRGHIKLVAIRLNHDVNGFPDSMRRRNSTHLTAWAYHPSNFCLPGTHFLSEKCESAAGHVKKDMDESGDIWT